MKCWFLDFFVEMLGVAQILGYSLYDRQTCFETHWLTANPLSENLWMAGGAWKKHGPSCLCFKITARSSYWCPQFQRSIAQMLSDIIPICYHHYHHLRTTQKRTKDMKL